VRNKKNLPPFIQTIDKFLWPYLRIWSRKDQIWKLQDKIQNTTTFVNKIFQMEITTIPTTKPQLKKITMTVPTTTWSTSRHVIGYRYTTSTNSWWNYTSAIKFALTCMR
jgi:hypothetical protein